MGKPKVLSNDNIDTVCSLYAGGKSTIEISKMFNCSYQTINNYLKIHNIKLRTYKEACRKYYIKVPKKLDEHMFYWIGFLLADGNVFEKGNTRCVQIGLKLSDKKHLSKLLSFLNSNYKIRCYKNACFLCIYSDDLIKLLKSYGVFPRKSLTAKVDKKLENNKHFWRGIVDGDGTIGVISNRNHCYINLNGTKDVCSSFLKFIDNKFTSYNALEKTICKSTTGNVYRVNFQCGKAFNIIQYLYKDADIFLDRKMNTYKDMRVGKNEV